MATQLFRMCSINVPSTVIRLRGGEKIVSEYIGAFPFMYWPDGRPCELINMYFLDTAKFTTGETLRTYASELSHLVRYCAKNNVCISRFSDSDFFTISEELQAERSKLNVLERARNKNTVRSILSRVIQFFLWYQKIFVLPTETPIIGVASESPQIIIYQKRVRPGRGYSWNAISYMHRAMPTSESREPKRPIALQIIEDIQQCIDSQSIIRNQSSFVLRRFLNRPNFFMSQLEYIRVRRHFMIWLMRRVGLRPSEMVEIDVDAHSDVLRAKRIIIPTKKRRRNIAPLRSFPITLQDATVFQRYLTARKKYLEVLRQAGMGGFYSNALFLGVDGKSIKKTSLERDFSRLVVKAGYKDVQACFSMFRHRFITYEVIVHLKEFMSETSKRRQMMTDTDYESILKRVATKTGHGSVQSLWHYIDLAWEEINVWGGVDRAISRLHAADQFFDDLLTLKHELETREASTSEMLLIQEFTIKLEEIVKSATVNIKDTDEDH